jgi:hypothetical protein
MERWLPYDEARLHRVLRVSSPQLRGWLRTNRRNLLGLARERGVPTGGLAMRLVGPRRPGVSRRTYAALLSRAQRTLTQSHLLLHILTHDFHQWSLLRATPRVFRVRSVEQWRRMRSRGMTPLEIARRSDRRDAGAIRRDVMEVLARSARRGGSAGATTRAQADRFLARQKRRVDRWLRVPLVRPAPKASSPRILLCHL